MITFYSSSNGIVDPVKAITTCVNDALPQADLPSTVKLIVLHTTMGHDFGSLLKQARILCPNAHIVGCTCAGVIGLKGANENMRALAAMFVCSDEDETVISSHPSINGGNSYEVARTAANHLKSQNAAINMVQVLATGIDIAMDRVIQGIEDVFGEDMPIFGGTSSDNMKAINSFQFVDSQVMETGIVMVGYADPSLAIDMVVHHGSQPIGLGFEITKCDGNRVFEIEHQAAWPFLMDRLDLAADTHPGPCIPIAGLGVELPSELHEEYHNKHILRVVLKVDEDGSLYIPVECQVGQRLWLTRRNEKLIFEGLEVILDRLCNRLSGKEVVAVFQTDCAARGRAMFDKINKEEIISKMQNAIGQGDTIPWLGMYGYGEVTQLGGRNRFHNYTTSLYAITRRKG